MVSLVSPVHTARTTAYIDEMARTSRVGVCPGHARRARRRPCRERDSRLGPEARLLPSISLTLARYSRPFGPSDLCPESDTPLPYPTEAQSKTRLHKSKGVRHRCLFVQFKLRICAHRSAPTRDISPPPTRTAWMIPHHGPRSFLGPA